MAYTCCLWAMHLRKDEPDISDVVNRVLGKKTSVAFRLTSGFALFLLTCVIYLLITDLLYSLLASLFTKLEVSFPFKQDTSGIDFSQFSVQYFGLFLLIPFGMMLSMKSISFVLRLSKIAMGCLVVYVGLIVAFFAENISSGRVQDFPINYWTSSIDDNIKVLSIISFAVVAHPSISPLLKSNRNYQQGTKSIELAFFMVTILYIICGVFGGLGLVGRPKAAGDTLVNYFKNTFFEPALGIPSVLYLLSIFPIYPYVSRMQILGSNIIKKKRYYYGYSSVLILVLALCQILNVDPSEIISFIGAVMCWLACYLLPILVELKQVQNVPEKESLLTASEQGVFQTAHNRNTNPIPRSVSMAVLIFGTLVMLGEFYYLIKKAVS